MVPGLSTLHPISIASKLTEQGPLGRGVSGPSCKMDSQPPRMDPLGYYVSAQVLIEHGLSGYYHRRVCIYEYLYRERYNIRQARSSRPQRDQDPCKTHLFQRYCGCHFDANSSLHRYRFLWWLGPHKERFSTGFHGWHTGFQDLLRDVLDIGDLYLDLYRRALS